MTDLTFSVPKRTKGTQTNVHMIDAAVQCVLEDDTWSLDGEIQYLMEAIVTKKLQ